MIVEQRTYDFQPGSLPRFFKLYAETGAREVQMRILGNLIGYFSTEIGELNQTVHMWGYESLNDRAERRAKLMADPVFMDFLRQVVPLIIRQQSKILLPLNFSPIGGAG